MTPPETANSVAALANQSAVNMFVERHGLRAISPIRMLVENTNTIAIPASETRGSEAPVMLIGAELADTAAEVDGSAAKVFQVPDGHVLRASAPAQPAITRAIAKLKA